MLTSNSSHQGICGSGDSSRRHQDSDSGSNMGRGAVQQEGIQAQLEEEGGKVVHIDGPQQQKHEGHF